MEAWNREGIPPEGVVALSFGGNLGDVEAAFRKALDSLAASGLELLGVSSLYATKPVACEEGAQDFLNAAAIGRWSGSPQALLRVCKRLEVEAGRPEIHPHWVSRPLDIDIIALGPEMLEDDSLSVPHPLAMERFFVLAPLAELAPEMLLPEEAESVGGRLRKLLDGAGSSLLGIRPFPYTLPVALKVVDRQLL